jgi:hypothetical protein
MRQETRNTDSAFQKTQGLLISGLCAVLEVCNVSDGDKKSKLAHAAVLLLTANREFNMKRRDCSMVRCAIHQWPFQLISLVMS